MRMYCQLKEPLLFTTLSSLKMVIGPYKKMGSHRNMMLRAGIWDGKPGAYHRIISTIAFAKLPIAESGLSKSISKSKSTCLPKMMASNSNKRCRPPLRAFERRATSGGTVSMSLKSSLASGGIDSTVRTQFVCLINVGNDSVLFFNTLSNASSF